MKGLALEAVVKLIILIVVALVVIGLMIYFSDDIKKFVENLFKEEPEPQAEIVESSKFSTAQIRTYMRACWDKTGEKFRKDVICYILKGDVSEVDTDLLSTAVEAPAQVDLSKFNPLKNVTIIRFQDLGNKIILES